MATFREILLKQERMQKTAPQLIEIEQLKEQLTASDYKVIKCTEYSLAGREAPYDVAELHAARQALRDKINALESEIAEIESEIK